MENVPDVIGTNNIKHFASWLAKLESFGYHCYWKVLNGRDYGIPQNFNVKRKQLYRDYYELAYQTFDSANQMLFPCGFASDITL